MLSLRIERPPDWSLSTTGHATVPQLRPDGSHQVALQRAAAAVVRASAPPGTENESKRTSFRPDDEGNTRIEEERSAYEQRQHKEGTFLHEGLHVHRVR